MGPAIEVGTLTRLRDSSISRDGGSHSCLFSLGITLKWEKLPEVKNCLLFNGVEGEMLFLLKSAVVKTDACFEKGSLRESLLKENSFLVLMEPLNK